MPFSLPVQRANTYTSSTIYKIHLTYNPNIHTMNECKGK